MEAPIREIREPGALQGRANGKLPDSILVNVPDPSGGSPIRLLAPAARAWRALHAAARDDGNILKAAGRYDSYRPYRIQKLIFLQRYTNHDNGTRARFWRGKKWYLTTGSPAAVPGESNHGRGLAVDVASETDGNAAPEGITRKAFKWLVKNELDFGFSHELDEDWHIRYWHGDKLPKAVLDFERKNNLSREMDMPLTDKEAELVADKVWHRDSDPTPQKRAAWLALHQARIDSSAALREVTLLRKEFAKFAKQDTIDDKALLRTLLTALSPQDVADVIAGTLDPQLANEVADAIFTRVNDDTPDPDQDPMDTTTDNVILDPADIPRD